MANSKRLILLIILTASAIGVLVYGFAQGSRPEATMPASAKLLWLAAAALVLVTAAQAIAPLIRDRRDRWAQLFILANKIPLIWCLLATACITSFVVAQVANTQPQPSNFWPLFALWLIAVGSVLIWVASGVRWSEVRPAILRERLWAHRWELAAVVALTVAAATVRVVNLTTLPSPYEQDEAALARESMYALQGQTENMFKSSLQGHATMQHFTMAAFQKVFGVNVFSSRLISALTGALTIPLLYLLLRQMFGRTVALLGATYLVGYHFHLHYSRVGLENIGDPFIMVAVLYFAWKASQAGRTVDFVLTGLVMGLGLYLSPAARVVPLIVLALFGYAALRRPTFLRQAMPGMGLLALAYGTAALPLGVFWITHQTEFMDRVNAIGLFQSGWIDREQAATGKSTLTILWDQAVHSFGAFGRYPDESQHYLAPIPFVDRLSLVPFLLGIGYALFRVLQERYFLVLVIFVAVVVSGGVLTIEPPTSQRLVGTTIAVAAFVAIGLKLLADAVSQWRPAAGHFLAGAWIAALLATNVHFYFFDYRTGGYYTDYNTYVAEQVVEYVRTLPEETRLFWYGAPKMYLSGTGHPSMTFPLRDWPRFDVMENGRAVPDPGEVVTGDAPAAFMFMAHREKEMQPLIDACPGGEVKTFISKAGRKGLNGIQKTDETSFVVYEVLAPNHCVPLPSPTPGS